MTLTKLIRKHDLKTASAVKYIRVALNEHGYDADDLDIEAAWSAVCLSLGHRPSFDLVRGFVMAKIVTLILQQMAEDTTEHVFEEPNDAGTSEEQDDRLAAEGEAHGAAEDQGEVPGEARRTDPYGPGGDYQKRRGRPPGRRGVESL